MQHLYDSGFATMEPVPRDLGPRRWKKSYIRWPREFECHQEEEVPPPKFDPIDDADLESMIKSLELPNREPPAKGKCPKSNDPSEKKRTRRSAKKSLQKFNRNYHVRRTTYLELPMSMSSTDEENQNRSDSTAKHRSQTKKPRRSVKKRTKKYNANDELERRTTYLELPMSLSSNDEEHQNPSGIPAKKQSEKKATPRPAKKRDEPERRTVTLALPRSVSMTDEETQNSNVSTAKKRSQKKKPRRSATKKYNADDELKRPTTKLELPLIVSTTDGENQNQSDSPGKKQAQKRKPRQHATNYTKKYNTDNELECLSIGIGLPFFGFSTNEESQNRSDSPAKKQIQKKGVRQCVKKRTKNYANDELECLTTDLESPISVSSTDEENQNHIDSIAKKQKKKPRRSATKRDEPERRASTVELPRSVSMTNEENQNSNVSTAEKRSQKKKSRRSAPKKYNADDELKRLTTNLELPLIVSTTDEESQNGSDSPAKKQIQKKGVRQCVKKRKKRYAHGELPLIVYTTDEENQNHSDSPAKKQSQKKRRRRYATKCDETERRTATLELPMSASMTDEENQNRSDSTPKKQSQKKRRRRSAKKRSLLLDAHKGWRRLRS